MAETFKNAKSVLADVATTVYTCPAATTAIVIGCQVSNVDSVDRTVEVWWTDSSDTDAITRLGLDVTVPVNSAYEPIGGKLILEAGDIIKASASVASSLEMSVFVLELT